MIKKIMSGAQIGADIAAADVALKLGIEFGGYVPKGRFNKSGRIPDKYPNLIETETSNYYERTELNIIHSDATWIFSAVPTEGGSKLTEDLCKKYKAAYNIISPNKNRSAEEYIELVENAKNWLEEYEVSVLNVAGRSEDKHPGIYTFTKQFLMAVLSEKRWEKYG